jgi:hypothetical protein
MAFGQGTELLGGGGMDERISPRYTPAEQAYLTSLQTGEYGPAQYSPAVQASPDEMARYLQLIRGPMQGSGLMAPRTTDSDYSNWTFPNAGAQFNTLDEALAAYNNPALRGAAGGQAYARSQHPNFAYDWSQTQNPQITDKNTGQVLQRGTNPSGDFGFEKFVIPALAGGIGFGAAGMGPLGGAGTGAAAGGEAANAIAPWGAGESVSGPYAPFGSSPAASTIGAETTFPTEPNFQGIPESAITPTTPATMPINFGSTAAAAANTLPTSVQAIQRILAGNGTGTDYLNLIGATGPSLLGAYASNRQTGAYKDLASQLAGYGAPSRARYEGSFAPGFSMSQDPGFTDALNQAGKASMHALSTFGNPAGSPNAWAQTNQDLFSKFAYPALQAYRTGNAAAGGISALTTAAPSATSGAIGSQANVYNAIGGGISDIFNPTPTLAQTLAQYTRMMRGA